MNRQNSSNHNIIKFVSASMFSNLWITMPISILYLQSYDMTYLQLALIEAFCALTILIAEIPSGAFADLVGKKWAVVLGYFGWAIGLFTIAFGSNFWFFFSGYIFIGLGEALNSGATSALLYDSLKKLKKEQDYLKVSSQITFLTSFMVIGGSILGGIFYTYNPKLPFIIHGSCYIIATGIIATIEEPFPISKKFTFQKHFQHMKKELKFSWNSPKIKFLIIFGVLIYLPTSIFVNIMEQPYLLSIGFKIADMGIIFALTRGIIGFVGKYQYKLEQWLGEQGSFYGISIIFILSFVILALFKTPYLILVMMLLFFTRDYKRAVIDKYANDHLTSEQRATILSILSFYMNVVYFMVIIIAGWILDQTPLPILLFIMGGFVLLIILPYLITNFRKNSNK